MSDKILIDPRMVLPLILDLLVELNSREMAFNKVVCETLEDAKVVTSWSDILRRIQSEKDLLRKNQIEHIYAEYGELHPDIRTFLDQVFRKD